MAARKQEPVFATMREKIVSIIRERYGGILPRGAMTQIAEEVGVSRQYVWTCAIDFAQAGRQKDDLRRRCTVDGCEGYARGRSEWCKEHINVNITCSWCGARFPKKRADHIRKMNRPDYNGRDYCTKTCFGSYIGTTFGFQKSEKESAG